MEETERGNPSVDRFLGLSFASLKQVICSANTRKAIFCTSDVRFFIHRMYDFLYIRYIILNRIPCLRIVKAGLLVRIQ
jgi:hypothetical protein